MTDPARIEAALRTFHGMAEMGCLKSTGKTLEQFVNDQADGGPIFNQLEFIFACSLVCMMAVLNGEEPAHAPHCTIYKHPMFDPNNCTCGAEGGPSGRA